jgi:hypothetical protein
MNYLVADGENSLKKDVYDDIPESSTCASTLSTDTSSEPRATVGTIECHCANVGRDR